MNSANVEVFSFKCAISSFIATYIAGALHPLEVVKTRFQSRKLLIKVMMEDQINIIKFQSTKVLEML